jgi:phage FluMu protein Com
MGTAEVSEPVCCEICGTVLAEVAGPGVLRFPTAEVCGKRGLHVRCLNCKTISHRPRVGNFPIALDDNTSSRQDMSN